MDKSTVFIRAAERLKETGEHSYQSLRQGQVHQSLVARVEHQVDRSRIHFVVGDACALSEDFSPFDVVHAANLLCRLADPHHFITRVTDLLRPGGQLLLTTPFTWLEEFTSKEKWVGGDRDSSLALKELLSPSFELEKELDLPFLIREHERKFQYGISLGMHWRLKY